MYRPLFIAEAYLTYFTTLIYHKVLINNKTEQDTEQDTTYRIRFIVLTPLYKC